jgi:lysophospholipase L1-like esterase
MGRSRLATLGSALVAAITLTAVLAPSAAAAPSASSARPAARHAAPAYYLSLGDSLAFGYSDVKAVAFATPDTPTFLNMADFSGYTEILAAQLGVDAVNYSCPDETTSTMINGGCAGMTEAQAIAAAAGVALSPSEFQHTPYSGTQLQAATAFLSHYRWRQRGVITVSIGADDVLPVAAACLAVGDLTCSALQAALTTMRENLDTILGTLRRAAPLASIVVLAPYNPYGFAAPASNLLAAEIDLTIAAVALVHFDRVADAFTPINITYAAQHCTYVYFGCNGSTDIHPTDAGYALLAQVFDKALQ